MNLISLFITSVLTENIVLTKFLGLCPFFGNSKKEKTALAMGLCVTLVTTLSSLIIKNKYKKLYKSLGIYLSLITTNCAVLGVVLLNINNNYNLLETIVYSLGSSIGFMLVIYVFSTIRERLEQSDIPKCFQGIPIALITASIMALIFERYTGI